MAIVSSSNKFIYLLNPRTASTATAQALRQATNARFVPEANIKDEAGKLVVPRKHTTMQQLRDNNLLTDEEFDTYFKFVTVRNPYDSVVSAWSKKVHDYAHLLEDKTSWVYDKPAYAKSLDRAAGSTFPEWVAAEYLPKLRKGRGSSMNRNFIRGVDRVLRYERLSDEIRDIAPLIGLGEDFELPVSNVTKGRTNKDYRSYYDEETREIVTRAFKEEIDALGYEF